MKNTFGQSVSMTVFGESHGEAVGVVLDGIAPGIDVDESYIKACLAKRAPSKTTDTARREKDEFKIVSGVFSGKSTGTPICIIVPNENQRSKDYKYGIARPSHADFSANQKYHGYEDFRGGGHFSGRVTAGIVAGGAILQKALQDIGVTVATHILECADLRDKGFEDVKTDRSTLDCADFPVLDKQIASGMIQAIEQAKADGDSVGGIVETAISGIPSGVGEPWFDSVESVLSHALFSIGGIKGVEFGDGFAIAKKRGSQANDVLEYQDGKVVVSRNSNGGINGGITNGADVIFRCAVKPTPSIAKAQNTIDFVKGENTVLSVKGRHDPAIVRRICPVIDAVSALCVCDMLAQRYGTDVLKNGVER